MFIWTLKDVIFVVTIGIFILWFIVIELLYLIEAVKEKIEKFRHGKSKKVEGNK